MNGKPIAVLLIEDNPGDTRLIREMLKEAGAVQFELACADRLSTGLERLAEGDIDVVLLDLGLPDSQGFDTLDRVLTEPPEAPAIVVLTGLDDESLAIQAVREGAQDYLVKGQVDGNLLARAMHYAIERQRAEEALRVKDSAIASSINAIALADLEGNLTYANPSFLTLWGYDDDKEILGKPATGFWQPEEKAAEVVGALREGESWRGELVARRKDGSMFDVQLSASMVTGKADKPICMMASFVDVTERKRAQEEARRHLERIEALREIDKAISSTLDLTEVLDIILGELERVIPYHSAGIFLLSDDTANLAAGRGFPDMARVLQIAFPVKEDALTYELLQGDRPLVLADAQADERFLARGGTRYTRSWIGVPLLARDRAVGFLTIDHREPGVYDEESAEMAQAFASQVAIAIENARLYEEAQRELAERKRAEEELRQSLKRLRMSLEGTVHALVSAIEIRDPYTAGHQQQVSRLACVIAKEMGFPEEQTEGLRMAGLIHDLGKITVPAEILSKPTQLNEFEWGMIKAHSRFGYDILRTVEFPWPVAQIVLQHHERLNGSGYPAGLVGEAITLEARILGVADVVEAMASFRPYRPARGLDEALEEISQNRGVLYDPEVVDACLKLFTEKGFEFE